MRCGFPARAPAAGSESRCFEVPPFGRGLRAFVLRTRRPVPGTGREPACAGRVPRSAPTARPCSWLGKVAAPLCGVRELGVSVCDCSRAAEWGVPRPWRGARWATLSSFPPCVGQGAPQILQQRPEAAPPGCPTVRGAELCVVTGNRQMRGPPVPGPAGKEQSVLGSKRCRGDGRAGAKQCQAGLGKESELPLACSGHPEEGFRGDQICVSVR